MSGDRARLTRALEPLPLRTLRAPDARGLEPWVAPVSDPARTRATELGKLVLWLALLTPNLVARLSACLAAPILALLVNEGGRLPRRLRWFETADNTAFGDRRHAERWAGQPAYLCFVAWLWRNKAYTFSNEVLGARTLGPVAVSGNPEIGDRPLVEGWCLRRTPEGYWHLYVVRRWGLGFVLRMNLGWKLWGRPGGPNFGQYVVTVNPLLRVRYPTRSGEEDLEARSTPWRRRWTHCLSCVVTSRRRRGVGPGLQAEARDPPSPAGMATR